MKKLKISIATFLFTIAAFTYAQEEHKMDHDHSKMDVTGMKMTPEFDDRKLADVYEHYEHIKNDLVGSNSGDAQKGAEMLINALEKIEVSEAAFTASQRIANSYELKVQRKAFSQLSNEMEGILREHVKSGKIYKDFCPMAFGNGAHWLSSIEDIRNPYYGANMINCGKVVEVIE
tara:strand:- start:6469 stop:6993 length:525 start_codon:yes stop_codon:yes gene_type:complete